MQFIQLVVTFTAAALAVLTMGNLIGVTFGHKHFKNGGWLFLNIILFALSAATVYAMVPVVFGA